MRKSIALSSAAVLLAAAACSSTAGGSSGGSHSAPSAECLPGINCPGDSHGGSGSDPQPTNPGAGHVSGICRFGIQSPRGDKGDGGSGLRPKKVSPVLINIVGLVYGYCTDLIHDFTLDMHIYGGPPGTHNSGTDFSRNKSAHELSYREVKSPVPGPIPVPYAITMPCIPGLELQLVYTYTARDAADNFVGGGPLGGSIVQYSAADCGAAR